jgi:hypothetical protein
MLKGREYLTDYLGWDDVTEFEVAAAVLLFYHSFGPSKGKAVDQTSPIFLALGNEGMVRYKCIFDNNNKKLVTEFFQDNFIRKLWDQVIRPNMSYELCFEKTDKPNPDIELTYREITRLMRDDFRLEMPAWWVARFPATLQKLSKK